MSHSQLRNLSDIQLEKSIETVRTRELETLSAMLQHLREIDRRRLYSKRGYKSLHDYAIRKLKYSEDQAHRRVSAARLARDLPEVEAKIADGSLKLTHLTDAHTLFRKVEHTKEEKLEILRRLENTTRAEARQVLQGAEAKARYSFEADKSLEEVIEELRGLHAHLSFDELMQKICLLAFDRLSPSRKAQRVAKRENEQSEFRAARKSAAAALVLTPQSSTDHEKPAKDREIEFDNLDKETEHQNPPKRYIPTAIRREVWVRAEGKCQKCSSKFGLEYDHIVPFALGGTNSASNLRLLCRNCNQRNAIEHYGLVKMSKYLLSGAAARKAPPSS